MLGHCHTPIGITTHFAIAWPKLRDTAALFSCGIIEARYPIIGFGWPSFAGTLRSHPLTAPKNGIVLTIADPCRGILLISKGLGSPVLGDEAWAAGARSAGRCPSRSLSDHNHFYGSQISGTRRYAIQLVSVPLSWQSATPDRPTGWMSVSHPHPSARIVGHYAPQRAGAAQRKVAMRMPAVKRAFSVSGPASRTVAPAYTSPPRRSWRTTRSGARTRVDDVPPGAGRDGERRPLRHGTLGLDELARPPSSSLRGAERGRCEEGAIRSRAPASRTESNGENLTRWRALDRLKHVRQNHYARQALSRPPPFHQATPAANAATRGRSATGVGSRCARRCEKGRHSFDCEPREPCRPRTFHNELARRD